MSDTNNSRLDEVALFRFGVIADLKDLPPGTKGIGKLLAQKASARYCIPGSTRTRVDVETLRHWLRDYRRGGFEALKPKPRKDAGTSHALSPDIADRLCALKEDNPQLSVQLLIRALRDGDHLPADLIIAPSTVHRLLTKKGLMRKTSEDEGKDRRRFCFEHANDLWMSDVMHGPAVLVDGRTKRKAYLIALIDDATRVVPYAAFALAENTSAFLPVLKQAILRRGLPKRLYVDNGSAFRSHHLALACAKLGITLIHARPYHPEGKGKQERWFRTVRMQLLSRLLPEDTESLSALNRRLWAWVEGEYHQTPHRGLAGHTPLDAWAARAGGVEYVGARPDIDDLFLFEERRRVARDRTVSLHGVVFEVDANLVGRAVVLRFDPARPRAAIQVFADSKRYPDAKPVDPSANCFVRRARAPVSLDGAQAIQHRAGSTSEGAVGADDGAGVVDETRARAADVASCQLRLADLVAPAPVTTPALVPAPATALAPATASPSGKEVR